jgi:preprotein translocase subunit SecY
MNAELRNRIFFTLAVLLVYRLGTFIPLPGIDGRIVGEFFGKSSNSILHMINTFSGGAFQRMSIFAINIIPYITASIIIQLMSSMYKSLEELRKEGEVGRRKLNQYTKYLAVLLGFFQAIGIYYTFSNLKQSAFISSSKIFLFTTVFTLLGSTLLLMWLGDQITNRGIGNGISLITTTGIVAELPNNVLRIVQISRSTRYSIGLLVLIFSLALVAFVVYMEKAARNVKMQYSNRNLLRLKNNDSYIPLKINISGVIPPIFASSVLMFPLGILQFFKPDIALKLSAYVHKGSLLYSTVFTVAMVFFSFFYSEIVFNTEELADNLKKGSCFIPGVRPGKNTADYFDVIVRRLTLLGSCYLVLICVIPDMIFFRYVKNVSIGGTSLLIVINTILELVTQYQAHVFSERYNNVGQRRRLVTR